MPQTARRGRPPWLPTDKDRRLVEAMHAAGVSEDTIAKVVGVSSPTLRKRCRLELDIGLAKANTAVAGFLFNGIVGSRTSPAFTEERNRLLAAIFWLKCRAGWKETMAHEFIRPLAQMSDEEIEARLGLEERQSEGNVVTFPPRRR